ncbi:hypothetical protein D3OALGA1CA_4924 [Olavius algarvensis associated proteobacterium Delta 3]|nr:hypothetical protein D3OALGB2SA_2209 [Olavius algarvensis associated proteobacterium Delta 3]CAB5158955.1 hypothetical protein D3OALGA1CA_4924 [Olavius algarvensis associated proteobacterium Delta 3]
MRPKTVQIGIALLLPATKVCKEKRGYFPNGKVFSLLTRT